MLVFNRTTNEGKTYTKKDSTDILFASKAQDFNSWFEVNSRDLLQYFKKIDRYDGAIFSDTYLKVYENILYRGGEVGNYKGLFLTAYFRIQLNERIYQNRFLELAPCHEKDDIDSDYHKEIEEANTEIERKIFEYVYSFYPLKDYEIFKMYINLQPAINYESLSKIVGIKYWSLFRLVSGIKKDIAKNYRKIISGEIYYKMETIQIRELDISYIFIKDYELLWTYRIWGNYTVICTVEVDGFRQIANMTPYGEIFAGDTCYSDFEGVSKSEFIKQCEELKVEFIKPTYPEAKQGELF